MGLNANGHNGQLGSPKTNGTVNTNHNTEIAELWTRYDSVKQGDISKNILFEDLLSRYEYLKQKHADYVQDHKRPGEDNTGTSSREKVLTANVKHLQGLLNGNPFVLILIDGDGLIFRDELICQGEAGGIETAATLEQTTASWATSHVVECPSDIKVSVRVYAHLHLLAKALSKDQGSLPISLLKAFFQGFSSSPLIDFVDIGPLNYRTETKVIEQFKLGLHDYHCRHILFGFSHSNQAYGRVLQSYSTDPQTINRVTLLEGFPLETNRAYLPFAKERFPGLFRGDFLTVKNTTTCKTRGSVQPCEGCTTGSVCQYPVRPENINNRDGRMTSMNDKTEFYSSTSSNTYSPLCSPKTIPATGLRKSVTSSVKEAHLRTDSAASNATASSDTNKDSWATITRARATEPLTNEAPKANFEYALPSYLARNKRGQRIDSPLEYDRESVLRLKRMKLCNQFYIGGGCCHYNAGKADKCPHRHDIDLNSSEKYCLRVVARETPCKRGTTCDDLKCIYGHKCPFPIATEGSLRGNCMNGDLCRFSREMHSIDQVPVKYTKITGAF